MTKKISAVDAIYSILEKVELLDKRISVIDSNLKILSNKVSKLNSNVASVAAAPLTPHEKESIQPSPVRQQKVGKLVLGNCRMYGYIVSKAKMPISGVEVNIFDDSSDLVKSMSTDENGYWEVRLPPGRYGVEYIHKKFKPINRTISLSSDDKSFEVR